MLALAVAIGLTLTLGPVPRSAPRYYGTSPKATATGSVHDEAWEASLRRAALAATGVSLDRACIDRTLHASAVSHTQAWFVEYAAATMLAVRAAPDAAAPSPLAAPTLAACAAKCPTLAVGASPSICLAPSLRSTLLQSTGFLVFPSPCVAKCALGGAALLNGNHICLEAVSTAMKATVRSAIWSAVQCPITSAPPAPTTAAPPAPGTCACDLRVGTPSRKTT